jgi:hypothetical protein
MSAENPQPTPQKHRVLRRVVPFIALASFGGAACATGPDNSTSTTIHPDSSTSILSSTVVPSTEAPVVIPSTIPPTTAQQPEIVTLDPNNPDNTAQVLPKTESAVEVLPDHSLLYRPQEALGVPVIEGFGGININIVGAGEKERVGFSNKVIEGFGDKINMQTLYYQRLMTLGAIYHGFATPEGTPDVQAYVQYVNDNGGKDPDFVIPTETGSIAHPNGPISSTLGPSDETAPHGIDWTKHFVVTNQVKPADTTGARYFTYDGHHKSFVASTADGGLMVGLNGIEPKTGQFEVFRLNISAHPVQDPWTVGLYSLIPFAAAAYNNNPVETARETAVLKQKGVKPVMMPDVWSVAQQSLRDGLFQLEYGGPLPPELEGTPEAFLNHTLVLTSAPDFQQPTA